MFIGTVLVIAALFLFLFNQYQAFRAAKASQEVLADVLENVEEKKAEDELPDPYSTEMTVVEIDGNSYIGYLTIPSQNLELPVMAEWSYPNLKISPCRYFGSVKTDDLVVAAHNYTRHFGTLSGMSQGDLVYFTDMDGVLYTYEVAEVNILAPADVEEMTAGEYDLTLFTCTYGGRSRVTVRCERVENN